MDNHTISWNTVIYVALIVGTVAYVLGAGSALLLVGLLRAARQEEGD